MNSKRSYMSTLFTPPTLEDGNLAETEWMLNWAVIAIFAAMAGVGLFMALLCPPDINRYALQTLEVAAVCAVALALSRQGHVIAGARWMVLAMCVFLMSAAWTSGGLESSAVAGYLVAVALAALILGRRAGLVTAAASLLAFGFLAYAQRAGLLPTPELIPTAVSLAVDMTSFMLILTVIGALFLGALNRSRAHATSELAERQAAEQRLADIMDNAPIGSLDFEINATGDLVLTGANKPALEILGAPDRSRHRHDDNRGVALT